MSDYIVYGRSCTHGKDHGEAISGRPRNLGRDAVGMLPKEKDFASFWELFREGRGLPFDESGIFGADRRNSHLHRLLNLLIHALIVLNECTSVQTLETYKRDEHSLDLRSGIELTFERSDVKEHFDAPSNYTTSLGVIVLNPV